MHVIIQNAHKMKSIEEFFYPDTTLSEEIQKTGVEKRAREQRLAGEGSGLDEARQ